MLDRIDTLALFWLHIRNADVIRRIRSASNWPSGSTIVALLCVLLIAMGASTAEAISPALFGMEFKCPRDGQSDDYGDGVVVRSAPGQLSIDRQWFGGFDALGSITTTGGAVPTASFNMQLVGSGEEGVNLRVQASAGVLYYFKVFPAVGEWTNPVRVRITRSGGITTNSSSASNIGPNSYVG